MGTVSNVLNRPNLVAEATRERVQASIGELGFIRNETARQLRQGRGHTLGVVVPSMANPYFADLGRAAEAAMNADGFDALWCTSDGSLAKEERCLDFLEEQNVSGVLISPLDLGEDRITDLHGRGLAVVLLDRTGTGVCSVGADHRPGGALAARHLLGRRHRRLLFVTGPLSFGPVRERHDGAVRAARDAGLTESALTTFEQPEMTAEAGRAAAERLLTLDPLPTGVFCANDLLALGLINQLVRAGVKVPSEISVVGYDDIDLAATAVVPLTTVRQPRADLGRIATELALAETGDPERHDHRQVVLSPELIVRESA
ncbi:substrate-binding domain-containing protein [Actinoallomurus purpureus]|nr:substrate-binding domain-containing protein [Actinoallomurus purpureus]